MNYLYAAICLILAVLRVHGEKGILFQAIAHMFVIWLFATAYYTKQRPVLYLAVVLSAVEVVCFFVGLKG